MAFTLTLEQKRERSPYYYIGPSKHAAVQTCLWTKKALTGEGFCYKMTFYGIQSHRCIQWSPCPVHCNFACRFCWRDTSIHSPQWEGPVDDAETLVQASIDGFNHLLNGYPGNPKTVPKRMEQSLDPIHTAISLDGEPTLYPELPALIRAFHKRKITTFLVTNGSNPKMLRLLAQEQSLPTQVYVSLSAWDEASFQSIQKPLQTGLWDNYLESLDVMREMDHDRRVLRMTLAKGLNITPESITGFSEIVGRSGAEYVEVKSYTPVGKSRLRLGPNFAPCHQDMQAVAKDLAEKTGYLYTAEHEPSQVVLLCRDESAKRNRMLKLRELVGSERAFS
ncbi:4-demethylwyosine synthase TYW1 [Candidatus Micrarchaeota archaeon]|nr:4-demethylwyosine synthase TYW1 [Candidatus Micrarchaeota archaeon]